MTHSTERIGFDQLPEAVATLLNEVRDLKQLVSERLTSPAPAENPVWMDLAQLCAYLPDKPSKATVYGWVCASTIPYHKKTKKLSFLKSEIDAWIIKSGHATADEIRDTALDTFGYRKGGLR